MTAPITVRPSPYTRARRALSGSVVVVVAAAIAGFLLVGQLRGRPVDEAQSLAAESESDLARILADLNAEADALQAEIAELKVQLIELRQSSTSDTEAAAEVEQQIRSLQVLAGVVPVTGPGLVITVTDTAGNLTYDAMIDVVQELRDAGAEALAVNDIRIGVATAFTEREGRILVDGQPITSPYRVAAIGQPATLEGGVKIPGGAVDAMAAVPGVSVEVAKQARIDLPALASPPTFDAARPVASGE